MTKIFLSIVLLCLAALGIYLKFGYKFTQTNKTTFVDVP